MNFKKWIKSIQTAGYNGAGTVGISLSFLVPDCDNVALVGNGFCNDETNIADCNYDGGDCCGPDISCKWPCLFSLKILNPNQCCHKLIH